MSEATPTPAAMPAGLQWTPATGSSNLTEFAYSAETKDLYVRFKNGGLYRYSNVPADVYAELTSAASKGGFLAARIKKAYAVSKL